MAEREHEALTAIRELLVERLRECRADLRWSRGYKDPRYRVAALATARRVIAQVRALDGLRDYARDRAYMAEFWMLIAHGVDRDEAVRQAREKHGEISYP